MPIDQNLGDQGPGVVLGRHDRAGLGDWWVSEAVYPNGIGPLIGHVTGLGMEFGIWVEPEMVTERYDAFRAPGSFGRLSTRDAQDCRT